MVRKDARYNLAYEYTDLFWTDLKAVHVRVGAEQVLGTKSLKKAVIMSFGHSHYWFIMYMNRYSYEYSRQQSQRRP